MIDNINNINFSSLGCPISVGGISTDVSYGPFVIPYNKTTKKIAVEKTEQGYPIEYNTGIFIKTYYVDTPKEYALKLAEIFLQKNLNKWIAGTTIGIIENPEESEEVVDYTLQDIDDTIVPVKVLNRVVTGTKLYQNGNDLYLQSEDGTLSEPFDATAYLVDKVITSYSYDEEKGILYLYINDSTTAVAIDMKVIFSAATIYTTQVYDSDMEISQSDFNYEVLNDTIIHFKDAEVKRVLLEKGVGGTVISGEITYDEAAQVTSLEDWFYNNKVIVSFNELKYFTGLTGIGDDPDSAQYDQWGNRINYVAPFEGCSNLNEVSIPDSAWYIGYEAFYGCDNLVSVKFGCNSNCTYFDDYSFYKSPQFGGDLHPVFNFKFPLYTDHIGKGAFYETNMQNTNIEELKYLLFIGDDAFHGYGGVGLNDINYDLIIPSSVTSIGNYAFKCCILRSITILGDPTIGTMCFGTNYNNRNLEGFVWKEFNAPNLTTMGTFGLDNLGINSWSFKKLNLPKLTTVVNYFFNHNDSIEELNLPSAVSIGKDFMAYCPNLKYFKIASTVTALNQYAFGNSYIETLEVESQTACDSTVEWASNTGGLGTGFKKLIIGDNITSIGAKAFNNCGKLEEVIIGSGVTSIADAAFTGCKALKKITIRSNSLLASNQSWLGILSTMYEVIIDDTVKSIGESAFKGCSSLTSIEIPNSVKSIGNSAFSGCSSLTDVIIPSSVTTINEYAFCDCSSLTSITIPNSVTSIAGGAFSCCSSLTSVTIPNSVTSIGDGTFSDCSSLTSITIPNSVTEIGVNVLEGCTSLQSLKFISTTPLSDSTFLSTLNTTCKIYVPQSALESYRTSWSSYKDRIFPIYNEKSIVGVEQGSTDTSIKITSLSGTESEVTLGSNTYATKTELSDYVTLDEANENLVIS
jgi:hypothetical protein